MAEAEDSLLRLDKDIYMAMDNRGNIEYRSIPERKKGTVIFGESSDRAAGALPDQGAEENLSALQKEARDYRLKGLDFQRIGNLDAAMALYQKAITFDPSYAVAYNDLGIIYEAKGFLDRAEESYLRAITIDPYYLSAYTNLALFYENKRDLDKAAFYWKKRADLGSIDDPWTIKARQRLEDISLVVSDDPYKNMREQEIFGLLKEVEVKKELLRKDNKTLAKDCLERAKAKFNKGDDVSALKLAIDASSLDPDDYDIKEFVEKVQARLLSR